MMRQRRNQELDSLEVPQGHDPLDDSNKKQKSQSSPSSSKQRRRKHHLYRVYLIKLQSILDYFGVREVDIRRGKNMVVRKIKGMTAVHGLVVLVGLTFVGLPLVLFAFSERHVIKENAIHYDVYHCPSKPPADYPREYPILEVLKNWPTSNLTIPDNTNSDNNNNHRSRMLSIHKGICVFDLSSSGNGMDDIAIRQQIQTYREREVPFIIRNDQDVLETVRLWSKKDYLSARLANKVYQATLVSKNDTTLSEAIPMSFDDWEAIANQDVDLETASEKYASLRLDGCDDQEENCDATYRDNNDNGTTKLDNADFLYEELSFFRSALRTNHNNKKRRNNKKKKAKNNPLLLYDMLDRLTSGIQCKFTSPGFLSETQLDDDGGNYIVMLGGKRRFLLSHPRNCPTLYVSKQKEGNGRTATYHSKIHLKNWTTHHHNNAKHHQSASSSLQQHHHHHHHNHPEHPAFKKEFPDFDKTTVNELILSPGDVLYMPTHWFHHVVSLTVNYQCKTPSAHSDKYESTIRHCLKEY